MLQCPVLHYSVIRRSPTTSLRVRILKTHLHTALTTSNNQLALVRAWRATVPFSNCLPTPSDQSQHRNLMITTWNCRGLTTGEPYIHQLAGEGSDIIAITEHWLWPFEAERLCQIHPSYTAEVKTDARLNANSTLSRGCGGVGLMWKKDLDAVPISSISSDRICGLRIKLQRHATSEITVLGVYLPCSDMGMECYSEHLVELENLISESERLGPIVIIGDFNAHLGKLGDVRGQGNPNQQGTLLHQLLVRCKLYAVSLSSISRGPLYTFWNSTTQTTVDYAIASQDASDYIQHCFTHESSPLNNSDHLPISMLLHVPIAATTSLETPATPKVNWAKALRSDQLLAYQQVSSIVNPLLGKSYSSPVVLNVEICSVSQQLCSAAIRSLPSNGRKSVTKIRPWLSSPYEKRLPGMNGLQMAALM